MKTLEPWIGEVAGLMRMYGIKQKEIAEIMGVTVNYVSMILTGEKCPKNAEERIKAAITEIIAKRNK